MPLPPSEKRISLEPIGAPEYWADILLLSGIRYKDVRRLFGDDVDPNRDQSEYVMDMMVNLITDWNIPENDGEEPMPIPSTDKTSVDKLHNIVVNFLIEEMSQTGQEVFDTENLKES